MAELDPRSRYEAARHKGDVVCPRHLEDHDIALQKSQCSRSLLGGMVEFRTLYRLYLRLGTVKALTAEAGRLRLLTKRRQHRDRRQSGGQPFTRGHLYWLLRNPIYVGEIAHRGSRHPGQHPAIIDHETFEAVQRQLQANATSHRAQARSPSRSLLTGLVYDETGDRLCPTHARKPGRRYRYYISKRLMHRRPGVEGGWRLPAKSFEDLVIKAIAAFLCNELHIVEALGPSGVAPQRLLSILEHLRASASHLTTQEPPACREMLERLVHRITLRSGTLQILIKRAGLLGPRAADDHVAIAPPEPHYELSVPFTLRRRGVEAKLIIGGPAEAAGQIDEKLQALATAAHSHLHRLASGEIGSVLDLAHAEKVDPSDVGRSLQVAFLAPDIVEAIVEGRQPVELTAWQLRRIGYLPLAWEEQRRLLGFST